MSAVTLTFRDLSRSLERVSAGAAIYQRVADAITTYGNGDGATRAFAIEAHTAGRPAWWTTATYHSQCACNLCNTANLGLRLIDALEVEYRRRTDAEKAAALDTLVPLNRDAADELSLVYARFGLWRDAEELEMRRVRDCRRPS